MDGNAAYDLHSTAAEEYRYSAPVEMPHAPRTTEAVVPESVPTPKQAIGSMTTTSRNVVVMKSWIPTDHITRMKICK